MFKLKSLDLKNFFSFEEAHIDFIKGLTLISGYDEGGKDSNGSGKSTILNAIAFALFGKTLKGVSGIDVVRWGCSDCKVILIITNKEYVYEIERTLNSIIFKINGVIVRGHKLDIQHSIEDTFRTNYALFIRSTAFSQGQVEFLGAAGDVEKKRLFKEILSLSRLDKAYDKIRIQYDFTYGRLERLENDITTLTNQRLSLETKKENIVFENRNWEKIRQERIDSLLSRKSHPPIKSEIFKSDISKLEKMLEKFRDMDEEIQETEREMYTSEGAILVCTKEIDKLWIVIQKGQKIGQRCELCGSIVNNKMLGAHKKELEEQIVALKNKKDELTKNKTGLQNRIQELYSMKMERANIMQQIVDKNLELARSTMNWEHYEELCQNLNVQIEELKSSKNPYEDIIVDLDKDLVNLTLQLTTIQQEFELLKKRLDTLAFVKFTLSREGVVGHIIEKEFSTLMSYANRLLSEISGGKLRISITPQRELKSGNLKEEIDISVYSNEQRTSYWGLSDGQRQRVNIALLLALNKLCKIKGINSFDFLLLDEVLDISLAEGGQESVIFLLKQYLRECSSIILISHKENFKASFTSCFSVYRDSDGISHLR